MFSNIFDTMAWNICSVNAILSSIDLKELPKKGQKTIALCHQQLYAVELSLRKISAEVEIEGIINEDKGRTEPEEEER